MSGCGPDDRSPSQARDDLGRCVVGQSRVGRCGRNLVTANQADACWLCLSRVLWIIHRSKPKQRVSSFKRIPGTRGLGKGKRKGKERHQSTHNQLGRYCSGQVTRLGAFVVGYKGGHGADTDFLRDLLYPGVS